MHKKLPNLFNFTFTNNLFIYITMIYSYKTYNIDYDYNFNNKPNTILFLHGWKGNKNSFISCIKFFNHQFNTITISLPPYNNSIIPLTLEDYKNIVYNILKLLNLNKVIIICHSFGLRVTLILATTDIIIEKVIITGGAGIKLKVNFFKKISQQFRQIFLRNNPEYYPQIASKDYKELSAVDKVTFKNIVNVDLTENIKLLKCPVLLFWGKKDTSTNVRTIKIFQKLHPCCSVKILKNGTHFCYLEYSQLFIDCCNNFINQK